jgi:hypothetical protein
VYLRDQLDAFFAGNQPGGGRDHRPMRETPLSDDARVTLSWFAKNVADVANKTVTQHRDKPTFPRAGEDGKYRLGDLMAWWPTRPGRGNWTPRAGRRGAQAQQAGPGPGKGRRASTHSARRRAVAPR